MLARGVGRGRSGRCLRRWLLPPRLCPRTRPPRRAPRNSASPFNASARVFPGSPRRPAWRQGSGRLFSSGGRRGGSAPLGWRFRPGVAPVCEGRERRRSSSPSPAVIPVTCRDICRRLCPRRCSSGHRLPRPDQLAELAAGCSSVCSRGRLAYAGVFSQGNRTCCYRQPSAQTLRSMLSGLRGNPTGKPVANLLV